MSHRAISPTFYLSLLEFFMASKQTIVATGNESDLTSIQVITLLLLDATRPRPMKSFCLLYHCDASNITGIVDGLEKKGLVSRQNDAHDRRIKTIQLEPSGKKLQQDILGRLTAGSGHLFEVLSDTEVQQFTHIIEKLAASQKCRLSA